MAMSVERGFVSGRRLQILLEDLLPLVVDQYEMVTALQRVASYEMVTALLLLRPQHAHVCLSYPSFLGNQLLQKSAILP
jgi:hypothetical protein